MAIPLLLDVFFWLGPQVTPWRAFKSLLDMADPELRELFASTLGLDMLDLTSPPAGPNVLTALAQTPGAPGSLAAALGVLPSPPGWEPIRLAPTSPWTLIGLVVALVLVGAPVAGLYITLAARVVKGGEEPTVGFWHHWLWSTGQLLLLTLLALLLMSGVVVGLSVMAAVAAIVNLGMAAGVLALGTLFLSWAMVVLLLFLYFVPASIALYRTNVLRAIVNSATFVWRNLWSSIGLILLSMIISEGFALIWRRLFTTLGGAIVSMGGNAFLTTGLTLGTFVFFRERFSLMQSQQMDGE